MTRVERLTKLAGILVKFANEQAHSSAYRTSILVEKINAVFEQPDDLGIPLDAIFDRIEELASDLSAHCNRWNGDDYVDRDELASLLID